MGTPCCCVAPIEELSIFQTSDWIALAGVLINSALAYWIVKTIQNRLANKRVLKDHFIDEIKEIRNEYRNCLNALYSNKTPPKTVTPWFKLMNIKVNDLMSILDIKYKIDCELLSPYQIDLQELITNNDDFIRQFKNANTVIFSETSRIQLIRFQQENNQIFNEIIIKINDAK